MILATRAVAFGAILAIFVTSPAWAEDDFVPPEVYTMTPGGVSLADGSFTYTNNDLTIGPLKFERFYLGGRLPVSGDRMNHNFNIYVSPNWRTECLEGGVCLRYAKPIVHFGLGVSGTYYEEFVSSASPPYAIVSQMTMDAGSGKLEHSAGTDTPYIYTDRDGAVYTFSTTISPEGLPSARSVTKIVFADGRQQDFLYNGSGKLKEVLDSSGYALIFDYNGSGQMSAVCGYDLAQTYATTSTTCAGATLKTGYGYTSGLMTSFTDVLGQTTTYGYGPSGGSQLSCVKPPNYSSCKVTNTYQGWQVTHQLMADGSNWNISYSGDYNNSRTAGLAGLTHATVTDPALKTSTYAFVSSSPTVVTDANQNQTIYRYEGGWDSRAAPDSSPDHGFSLAQVTFPEGNQYLAEYAGPRRSVSKETLRAKPGSGLADRVNTFGYTGTLGHCEAPGTPQNCAKPIWKRDANGNQTDWSYASWGGMLSEMLPAPVAGAARPLKLYTYVQKYAYVRSSGGSLVPSGPPIWMPSTITECQTMAGSGAATCDLSAPQRVTTYEYGPDGTADNLLVRGVAVTADGQTLRTCYGYDVNSNKIFETKPRAGLASCS